MRRAYSSQHGLTLIELLVALVISSVIALAAFSAIVVSRQGFATVDAASQLRDNARFATEIMQRLGVQTGFQDVRYAATKRSASNTEPANISGFDNGTPSVSGILVTSTTKSTTAVGYGSDVLILRYQAPETYPGSGQIDRGIIDCMGRPASTVVTDRDERLLSVLYVAESRGQPALMCRNGAGSGQPLVESVENFQVLYGIDGDNDSVTDRYMRANQLIVAGDDVATKANWEKVRSIKIGLILRSSVGATQETASQTLHPFGSAKASASAAIGSAFADSTNDPGTVFIAPADRRLRLQTSFTIHLRNEQNL